MQPMEIPDEAADAAWTADENAYHYSTEEIAAKIADRVPHADLDGFPLSQRIRIGKAVAPLFQELLPPPAPAGDGGLREALEELKRYCSGYVDGGGSEDEQLAYDDIHIQLSQILQKHPAAPAGDGGLREALEKLCDRHDRIAAELSIRGGVKATYDIPGSELRSVLAAHPAAPAVPQPVDREALRKLMNRHPIQAFNGSQVVCGCNRTWVTSAEYRAHLADAVLAVLAGEQEQVQ